MAISEREHIGLAAAPGGRARTVRVVTRTAVPAERVLEAARDFSARRADVFPAVRIPHMAVHELGASSADVTEGTPVGIGVNWERCRYDWSRPGVVTATVTESNVYAVPGSVWEIRAVPDGDDGGSRVEMVWERRFAATVRGRLFGALYTLLRRPLFGRYARQIVGNLERAA
jgi:hypothetical protein